MTQKIVLSSELSIKIDQIITRLRDKTHSDFIVLTDISGQLLAFYARHNEINVQNLAALFASNMGATSEIANEVLEKEGFDFNLHEGKANSIFVSKIRQSFLLAVVFRSTETVGFVRLFTKRACKELHVLTYDFERQLSVGPIKITGDKYSDELAKQFSDILGDKIN